MKSGNADQAIQAAVDAAEEMPDRADQRNLEATVLNTLAAVINSDVSDLKYSLLELDAGDFYFQGHRDSFAAMKALDAAGDHVDQLTVEEKGAGWPDPSKALSADEAETFKRRIIARANHRQAAGLGRDFQDAVEAADPDDLPGLVAGLQAAVLDIGKTKRFMPPDRAEADLVDAFVQDLTHPSPGYWSGFSHLDAVIGGLRPGVFVIAAAPSAGKTTFIKQMADQVAECNDGVPVLFFSYEQSASELRRKTLARLSKIDNQRIREGKVQEGDLAVAVEYIRRFGRRLKVIEADVRHNVGMIRLIAQREKHQAGKSPVIFIDYLQIMPAADLKMKDKRAEVDSLVSELRRLARDIDVPVIVISSMSRAYYDQAKVEGFKESGGIEYGADLAAIMSVQAETPDRTERSIDLVILKNRNGGRRIVELNYKMKFDTFADGPSGRSYSYLDAMGKDPGR
jgi:replicative DNA helicase